MISTAQLLRGKPVKIQEGLKFFQPSLADIVDIGEETYEKMINIWNIEKKDVVEDAEFVKDFSEYEFWKAYVFSSEVLKGFVENSITIFLRKKIEFLPAGYTIYLGDIAEGIVLNESLFLTLRQVFKKLRGDVREDDSQQYKEEVPMDAKTKALVAKMKGHDEKMAKMNSGPTDPKERLGKNITALVVVGNYTYEQVYEMTMLQFISLLQTHINVESYRIYAIIRPHISSEGADLANKHWLET